MEHRAGIEPANTGFADQRVSHFATGALIRRASSDAAEIILAAVAAHNADELFHCPELLRLRGRPQVRLHRLITLSLIHISGSAKPS